MKVQQLINAKGNANANQFIIYNDNIISFQSYNSLIASYDKEKKTLTFGQDYDYSTTTSKHLNTFLKDYLFIDLNGRKEIKKAIEKGSYNNITILYNENL